jgi:hypothetical protein
MPIFSAKGKNVWSFTFVFFGGLECEDSHFHLVRRLGICGVIPRLPHAGKQESEY